MPTLSRRFRSGFFLAIFVAVPAVANAASISVSPTPVPGAFPLVTASNLAEIRVDDGAKVVNIAANLLAEDVQRVTDQKPSVNGSGSENVAVLIGTVGNSQLIDGLIASGKLDVTAIKGKWEASMLCVVTNPTPGVKTALVIVGSDRRGTAYGVFTLSEAIGVSPWYWWADVTPGKKPALYVSLPAPIVDAPAVKYRGIFINDEDWGLQPWAAKTFDPKFGNIGPKTYEKVFELLLRLKANYLWPAMHPCSTEFGTVDENIKLADDWGIVMGASHAEPMNRNNVHWDKARQGEWRYDTNRDVIFNYWEEWAKKRGPYEATWTIGIRGIHDSPMNGPKDMGQRVKLLEQVFADQRSLLAKYVNPDVTKVPQVFVPYKEVLPLYQHGLKVPDDVTLVWPDDNYGYIRRLPTLAEQKRPGGSGIYYHLSYYGTPEDYLWLCTTPPALVWEEMVKAYNNGARTVWIVNVGDIKPAEIGMEFFLELARHPDAWDQSCQMKFLQQWAAGNFGPAHAAEVAAVLDEYYRLNFAAKPEHLDRAHFTNNYNEISDRLARFAKLVERTDALYAGIDPRLKDAFYETVVYPVRCSALMNEKWLSDSPEKSLQAYEKIQAETKYYNENVAGGKWRYIMSDAPRKQPVFGKRDFAKAPAAPSASTDSNGGYVSLEAEQPTRKSAGEGEHWDVIEGLSRSGDSIALRPVRENVSNAAKLEYSFNATQGGSAKVYVYCIPTHAIHPETKLRYAVSIDSGPETTVDIESLEFSKQWSENVLHATAVGVTEHSLAAGKHLLTLRPVNPGLVFDKIVIDLGGLKPSYLGPPAKP